MYRSFLQVLSIGTLLGLAGLTGCASRPIQTVMRGAMRMTGDMNMTGNMEMDGRMNMEGDMRMSGEMATVMRTDNTASRLVSVPVYASLTAKDQRSVVVVDVDGILLNKNIGGLGSMGENPVALFREKLDAISADPQVGAIVLRINSPGGGVTAADVMTRDLLEVKQQRALPVVACIMDVGAGGAYFLSSATDHIVSHPTSLVGGLGVLLNIYFVNEDLSSFGVESKPVVSGNKITMATPERTMEPEERELLESIALEFHERFVEHVSLHRQLSLTLGEGVADGRIVTGTRAHTLGLVDQVGYLDDAVVMARELAQLPADAPIKMLRRDNDRAYTLLDITPNTPTMTSLIPLKLPGLDRSQMPTFLYMWQPEPSMITGL